MPLFSRVKSEPSSAPTGVEAPPATRVLFLDDDPLRAIAFHGQYPYAVWVQTAAECIARLEEPWDEVHLDHDLGGEQFVDFNRDDCGMEVVRWICSSPRPQLRVTRFTVHSHNPTGAIMMVATMQSNGYLVDHRPFGAPPPPPLEEVPNPPPSTRLSLTQLIRRLLGRETATTDYGYTEFRRDGLDAEAAPPERPDFDWELPPRDEDGVSPP